MLSKQELIGALCTVLAFASAGQILITGILIFEFPHFLSFSHCHLPTAAGVLSGLVAVPMVIQLKTAQISHHIELKYGYTKWYQILAICVCALLHFAALILAVISLGIPRDWNGEFKERMLQYNDRISAKSLIDNTQWALQCCGFESYKDWTGVKWTKTQPSETMGNLLYSRHRKNAITKAVPFSCCARKVLGECLHYDLLQAGVRTISTEGCGLKVKIAAFYIIGIEMGMYMVCIIIECVILACLCSNTSESDKEILFKRSKSNKFSMDGMTCDSRSTLATRKISIAED